MIIISLDEQGHFESENKEPMFIAGLIFDDLNDEKEEKNERQRIEAYYTAVMNNLGSY